MQFVLVSDIHIDLVKWRWDNIMPQCYGIDTIVIAGDISNDIWTTCNWLVEAKSRFSNVLWVAGNHDFYNQGHHRTRLVPDRKFAENWPNPRDVEEMLHHYEKWSTAHNIHFLNRKTVKIKDITFVGTTGWHDYLAGEPFSFDEQVKAWYNTLSDTTIRWQKDQTAANHLYPLTAANADAVWLNEAVSDVNCPMVVVTHHLPHRRLRWEMPHDVHWTQLHGSFVNTLCESINSQHIKMWCYGHTHQRKMIDINGITYVCNSRGYQHENPNWQPIILEV